jgi:phosphohistidine phosphatase
MKLYLLRHGLAVEPGTAGITRDSDRPLTPEGCRKLKAVTAAMQAMELSFEVILSSPFVRARQTAEIVAQAFEAEKRLQLAEELACGGNVRELLRRLAASVPVPESVLLVGHEPDLSELVSMLCTGEPKLAVSFKKGGLCRLSVESLRHGRCATLDWLLTPKLMALMA